MIDQELLSEVSRYLFQHTDLRVLQGFRLGPSEREHIAKLLTYMDPPVGSTWLDVGCGFGEPARLMAEIRPDLEFALLNNNRFQLDNTPVGMTTHFADMHALPFADHTFDGVMFLYSLCHADNIIMALNEAWRVVRPGGRLFVFDYVRIGGNDALSSKHLASSFHHLGVLQKYCRFTGWEITDYDLPGGSDAVFRSHFEDQELYDRIFANLLPAVWWAVRR